MKMQTFRKPHQWLNFWLEKYTDTLSGLKYTSVQRKQYWTMLKKYLIELPGNPRNIPLDKVQEFIEVDSNERALPIMLFYKHIAPSKPHLELLNKLLAASDTTVPESDDPLEHFKHTLSQQSFSPRTVKNYTSSVAAYLNWGNENGKKVLEPFMDEYIVFLTDVKKLSPRTIALHTAAIKLFNKQQVHSHPGS
jgi:hypothetical protein